MLVIVGALLLAVFLLPSALNLPQADPGQTLEYAPVPGNNGQAPPGGNTAALGLGQSGTVDAGGSGFGSAPPPPPSNVGGNPSTKQCVGSPPRQTEDPLSPPCVAFYDGNNGGSTYRGVNAGEVRLLFYVTCDGSQYESTGDGPESPKCGSYYDLGAPASSSELVIPRVLRTYQVYFTDRFQTYKRKLHIYVHYGRDEGESSSSLGTATPADREADAAQDIQQIDPFAVVTLDFVTQGNEEPYIQAMAQHGVLNFGSFADRSESFFNAYPKLIWSYPPAAEVQAQQFISYVCQKVIPYPVSFSGNVTDANKTRVLGLMTNADPRYPEMTAFGDLVRKGVEGCGGKFMAEHTYSNPGSATCTNGSQNGSDMADFKKNGVTTIIWAQGLEEGHGCEGASQGYLPEVVFAGDGTIEDYVAERYGNAAALSHSVVVSNVTVTGPYAQEVCGEAATETNPRFLPGDLPWACFLYPTLRQIATGIQVAGPKLNPDTVDQGFHAIPAHASSDPKVPACFYNPGDYTCVKDAEVMWWDPSGVAPTSSGAGCWRSMEGGTRYLTGRWPPGNVTAQEHTNSDPCNGYQTGLYPNPGG